MMGIGHRVKVLNHLVFDAAHKIGFHGPVHPKALCHRLHGVPATGSIDTPMWATNEGSDDYL